MNFVTVDGASPPWHAVDALIVASAASINAGTVEAAAARGKPVLLGAPITTSLEDADRVVVASRRVPILVAQPLRFVPGYAKARAAVHGGGVGGLTSGFVSAHIPSGATGASMTERDWYCRFVDAGDGFGAYGVQLADLLRWLAGEKPVSVVAVIRRAGLEVQADDYVLATYTLAGGARITLEMIGDGDRGRPLRLTRGTVFGTKGRLELQSQSGRAGEPYRTLLAEFHDLVAEDREPSSPAADGRIALEMILAARESARTGRSVSFPYTGAAALMPWPEPISPGMPPIPEALRPVVHAA
jgi:predicted dehydrogenase